MADGEVHPDIYEATVRTSFDLRNVASTARIIELSQLDLPDIERLTNEIARVIPAGNVPGIILSGLTRLDGRTIDQDESRKHINLLFRGIRLSMDVALYSALFAGPAAVLYGYQQLLRLAGKAPESAFPEGTWQFYLEFALREDSARHANETTGFQANLPSYHGRQIDETGQLTSWILAAAHIVTQLPDMLANEWRERVLMSELAEAAAQQSSQQGQEYYALYPQWERQRPFHRAADETYADSRRRVFDAFWLPYYNALNRGAKTRFDERYAAREADWLAAYQRQLSWLAFLEPDVHNERRVPYDYDHARLGVISQGRYYLFDLRAATNLQTAYALAAMILQQPLHDAPANMADALITVRREHQAQVRKLLDKGTLQELDDLRQASVLINWDMQDGGQTLSRIRQAKRGIGDHALTIFRTDRSMVFDQSHIFFDGAWGAGVAQVMTNEALIWAQQLVNRLPASNVRLPAAVNLATPALNLSAKAAREAAKHRIGIEISAENAKINMKSLIDLRKLLKQRNDLAQITVNDLFILYRSLHASLYQPSEQLQATLAEFASSKSEAHRHAYQVTVDAIKQIQAKNPAILIPIDASRHDPRERVFPTTFRNPLTDFMAHHHRALRALYAMRQEKGRGNLREFEEAQTTYLRLVGGFGELLTRYKQIALRGESTSTATIKVLGHLPGSVRKLLDNIPNRVEVLNEVIKGEEVFSNIGRVTVGSTLRRFMTAKDDNQQKTLTWSIQTDDKNVAHVTLRDFRPYVKVLLDARLEHLAQLVVQDYLDVYVNGLNHYVVELGEITIASAERPSLFSAFRRK